MSEEPAALRTRSTRPKLPGLSDRLRVVRLEGEEDVDPLLVAFLRAQEAAAEAEAAVRLANKVGVQQSHITTGGGTRDDSQVA